MPASPATVTVSLPVRQKTEATSQAFFDRRSVPPGETRLQLGSSGLCGFCGPFCFLLVLAPSEITTLIMPTLPSKHGLMLLARCPRAALPQQ